jgi:CMP-N-acetylneuraminic acid synthetase
MAEALGVIPARGGSKTLPRKNLLPVAGAPLIHYTFCAARKSQRLTRIVLSTDDAEIAALARQAGLEVPFMRPAELAEDDTAMLPVIQHAVRALEGEGYRPDVVVILQPTSPLRREEHIDAAIDLLLSTGADSVISVVEVPHQFNPISVMRIEGDRLVPFVPGEGTRVLRRHEKPRVYARNGAAVYAVRYSVLMSEGSLFGDNCRPLVMEREESIDVDDEFDLFVAGALLDQRHRARGL